MDRNGGSEDEDNRTQAGYRVDEVLRGSPLTVNGRTTEVSGEAVVAGSKLESATFTVDVASITSRRADATTTAARTSWTRPSSRPPSSA